MNIVSTDLPEVKVIEPKKFGDSRGFFSEVYKQNVLDEAQIDFKPVQDNQSLSAPAGTVRGLHFQRPSFQQAKLVRVLRGAIIDVAVDIRHGSPTFGKHVAIELSADNFKQLFVPAGFAHGFCTLVDNTEVLYKVDNPYAPEHDAGILWNDPALGIDWGASATNPLLSDKDKVQPLLSDLEEVFPYSEWGPK